MKVKRTFFSLEEVSSAHQDFIRQAMADRPLSKTHQTVEDVSSKLVAKSTSDVGVQVSTLSAIKERQVTSNALKVCLHKLYLLMSVYCRLWNKNSSKALLTLSELVLFWTGVGEVNEYLGRFHHEFSEKSVGISEKSTGRLCKGWRKGKLQFFAPKRVRGSEPGSWV